MDLGYYQKGGSNVYQYKVSWKSEANNKLDMFDFSHPQQSNYFLNVNFVHDNRIWQFP
jgi:hypothetical protein